jgi:uncharacterized protein YjiS (DUF1127 family)
MDTWRPLKRRRHLALAHALRRVAGWPFRVAADRAALRQLAGMSERELGDIQMTRQDFRDATALAPREDHRPLATLGPIRSNGPLVLNLSSRARQPSA